MTTDRPGPPDARQPGTCYCVRCGAWRWTSSGVCPTCGCEQVRRRRIRHSAEPWWRRRDWSDPYLDADQDQAAGQRRDPEPPAAAPLPAGLSWTSAWRWLRPRWLGALAVAAVLAAALLVALTAARMVPDARVDEITVAAAPYGSTGGSGMRLEPWPGEVRLTADPHRHYPLQLTAGESLTVRAEPAGAVVVHNSQDLLHQDGCRWGAERDYPALHIILPDDAATLESKSLFFIVGCRVGAARLLIAMQDGETQVHVFDVQR